VHHLWYKILKRRNRDIKKANTTDLINAKVTLYCLNLPVCHRLFISVITPVSVPDKYPPQNTQKTSQYHQHRKYNNRSYYFG
jgi:hypothetical protein